MLDSQRLALVQPVVGLPLEVLAVLIHFAFAIWPYQAYYVQLYENGCVSIFKSKLHTSAVDPSKSDSKE